MANDFNFKSTNTNKDDESQTGLLSSTKKNTNYDDAGVQNGTLKVDSSGAYYNPESTAETLNSLLNSGSSYVTNARANSMQSANNAGLRNSTMAATAGEKAAIESSLPIAQQDSAYYQDRGLASQQGLIQERLYNVQGDISSKLSAQEAQQTSDLSKQEFGQTSQLSAQEFGQSSKLSEQGYQQSSKLSAQEAGQASALSAQEYGQSSKLSAQEASQNYKLQTDMQQAELAWNKQDLEARLQLEYDTLSQEAQQNFSNSSDAIGSAYMDAYLNIMTSTSFASMTDRQEAIDVLNAQTQSRYDLASKVAGVDIKWDMTSVESSNSGYYNSSLNTNRSPSTTRTPSSTTNTNTNNSNTPSGRTPVLERG